MESDDSILDLESVTRFQALSLSRQERLLASSYPSIRFPVYPLHSSLRLCQRCSPWTDFREI
jgi:hypothetical protein